MAALEWLETYCDEYRDRVPLLCKALRRLAAAPAVDTQQTGAAAWVISTEWLDSTVSRHVQFDEPVLKSLNATLSRHASSHTVRPLIYGDTSPGARVDEAMVTRAAFAWMLETGRASCDMIAMKAALNAALNAGETK